MDQPTETFRPVARVFWWGRRELPWQERPRLLYDHELVWCSQGQFQLYLQDQRHDMRQGSLTIIPPGLWHETRIEPGRFAVRHCQHFDWTADRVGPNPPLAASDSGITPQLVHAPPPKIGKLLPIVLHRKQTEPMRSMIELFFDHAARHSPLTSLLLWPVLAFALNPISASTKLATSEDNPNRTILNLREYIEQHYEQPLNYNDFVRVAKKSKAYLCDRFTRLIGKPPTAYLIEVRLHHAQRLLSSTDIPIAKIAERVGIPDANYFARLYRQHHGVSPSHIRRRA